MNNIETYDLGLIISRDEAFKTVKLWEAVVVLCDIKLELDKKTYELKQAKKLVIKLRDEIQAYD